MPISVPSSVRAIVPSDSTPSQMIDFKVKIGAKESLRLSSFVFPLCPVLALLGFAQVSPRQFARRLRFSLPWKVAILDEAHL